MSLQVLALLQGIVDTYTPDFVLPLPDGVISFTYRLVMELVKDCLTKYHQGCISLRYLQHLQMNIRTLVDQAEEKSQSGELAFFKQLAQNVLYVLEYILEGPEAYKGDSEKEENLCILDPNTSQRELNSDLIEEITVSGNADHGIYETPKIHESASAMTRSLNPERKPCKSDYKSFKLISSGAFGAVHLVHHKDTNQVFAMKKLDKQNLKKPKQVERAFQERDILAFADCPFVVSMFCSFPTKSHLCLVMEYVAGGDCARLLKLSGPLPVPLARIYIAETVLAVEYLHSYGVLHRDLKPENLLITPTGHIKVTDFGLSKMGLMRPTSDIYTALREDITREFCDSEMLGTPYYKAPEVLLMKGYGRPVDWWSVGIILHEFILGFIPFHGNSKIEVYESILRDNIIWKFYNKLPPLNAQNIITGLLRKSPEQRLGTRGANEIKNHLFLCNLDFANLLRQRPLYVPRLVSDVDTCHFETRSERHKHMDSSEGDPSEDNGWPESHNFESSSQRHVNICTTNTIVMNNDDLKEPPVYSPIENIAQHSEIQKESSATGTIGDNQHVTARDSSSSSSIQSEFPDKKSRKSVLKWRKKQKTEIVEEVESRRGSIFRRVILSCRRGFTRAVRTIRGCCIFAGCCCGKRNIS